MKRSTIIKAVLFDLDGTLLDTESLSDKAILKAFGNSIPKKIQEERRQDGDRLPWEIKKQIVGKRGDEWVPMVIAYAETNWVIVGGKAGGGDGDDEALLAPMPSVAELWDSWESNLNSFCAEVEECRGATALVHALAKAQVPLAIATSSRMASVQKKRQRHERIFKHMQTIVTGDDPSVTNGKPAPDIYVEAARRLGVDPAECLVFEDATAGCQSGKAAGCSVIAVPDPRMDKSVFDGIVDEVLDSLKDFDPASWGINYSSMRIEKVEFDTPRLSIFGRIATEEISTLANEAVEILTPTVTKSLPWESVQTANEAEAWILAREQESHLLIVRRKADSKRVGFIFLYEQKTTTPGVGIDLRLGYLLAKDSWGEGFGTELVRGMVQWCHLREEGTIQSLIGGVEVDNVASIRILEKCGFTMQAGDAPEGVQFYEYRLGGTS